VNDCDFKIGEIVKLGPDCPDYPYLCTYKAPRFVVEQSDPMLLACRCISGVYAGSFGYTLGTVYFGPPSYFVRCSIKEKFRGRELCGRYRI